jgi:hypothetical protein
MAASIPTTEPAELRIGDTWQWRREDLSDWPASVWTLSYHLRNASAYIDITAAADGDAHSVSVPAATSATYSAGDYEWVAFVTDGSDRFQAGTGRVKLTANVALAAAYDARGFARRMLDAVEARLESRATADQLDMIELQLEDRQLQRDRGGLIKLRSQLIAEVRREEGTGGRPTRIQVRFPS